MTVNTGGGAFPEPADAQWEGMTLRDYFAAQAIPAIVEIAAQSDWAGNLEDMSSFAYRMADAMLQARK